jgi:Phage Terminase
VREIAYDPWNATHIALRLQDEGATMVEFRQGFRSMSAPPTRELEKLIVSKKLAHGANPVTRWMAANVAVAQDPAGNLKPPRTRASSGSMASSRSSWRLGARCCPGSPRSRRSMKIETIRDDGLIEGADPAIAALTGRIDVRFADTI